MAQEEIVAGFEPVLAYLIIGLPLAGAVVLLLFGKRIGRLSGVLACGTIGLAAVIVLLNFIALLGASTIPRCLASSSSTNTVREKMLPSRSHLRRRVFQLRGDLERLFLVLRLNVGGSANLDFDGIDVH